MVINRLLLLFLSHLRSQQKEYGHHSKCYSREHPRKTDFCKHIDILAQNNKTVSKKCAEGEGCACIIAANFLESANPADSRISNGNRNHLFLSKGGLAVK